MSEAERTTDGDEPRSHEERVDSAFVEFLLAEQAGEAPEFEAWCAEHPELAADLARRRDEWVRVQAVVARLERGRRFEEAVQRRFAGAVDPAISLDRDEDSPSGTLPDADALRSESARTLLGRFSGLSGSGSGRYTFKNEIARGGMGAVCKVWDANLRRALAMKVMLTKERSVDDSASKDPNATRVSRFLEEAQITGQLDHPGIVPVHEMGIDDEGRLYFTMPLVKGREFKQIIDFVHRGEEGWTLTRALGVILKVCEAMAFSHSKGVIHRDLKPANIMVGRFGETYVMDWGLAKVLDREDARDIRLRVGAASTMSIVHTHRQDEKAGDPDSPLVTMDGDIVGTPAYMAPEQARGRVELIGPQSDVYAVGAMLYHLLTGQMPYVPLGERVSPHTVLNAVCNGPPWPVAQVVKDVPEELIAICEKAMARELDQRYSNIMEMAEDLRAFLEGRVVHAYETGALAEFRKWVRRNRGLAAAIGAAIFLTIAGLVVVLKVQADANSELEDANAMITSARNDAIRAKDRAVDEKDRADAAAERALEEKERADENARLSAARGYQASLIAADSSLRLAEVGDAQRALEACDEGLRNWEWHHLALRADTSLRLLESHSWIVSRIWLSDDGRSALTAGWDGQLRSWDIAGGEDEVVRRGMPSMTACALAPDRDRVFFTSGTGNNLFASRFGAGIVHLSGEMEPVSLEGLNARTSLVSVAWSPDGEEVAATLSTGEVWTWDAETGELRLALKGFEGPPTVVAYSPTGELYVAHKHVVVLSRQTGEELRRVGLRPGKLDLLVFDADGRHVAASYEETIWVWDLEQDELVSLLRGHRERVTGLDFAREGAVLASSSLDWTVRIWDVALGTEQHVLRGATAGVYCVDITPDGELVGAGFGDSSRGKSGSEGALVWALDVGTAVTVFQEDDDPILDAEVSPDGRWLLAGASTLMEDGPARAYLWDTVSGQAVNVLRDRQSGGVAAVAWSRDSRRFATSSLSGTVHVWDAQTGMKQLELGRDGEGHDGRVDVVEFHSSGRYLLTGGRDKTLRVWDAASGALLTVYRGPRGRINAAGFAPVGEDRIAYASYDRTVGVVPLVVPDQAGEVLEVDVDEDAAWTHETGSRARISCMVWSPDGTQLVAAYSDRAIYFLEASSGEELRATEVLQYPVYAIAWSPDGSRILSGGREGWVEIWNVETLEPLLRLEGHESNITSVGFTPDGSGVLASSFDGSVWLWETSRPLERWLSRTKARETLEAARPLVESLFDEHTYVARVVARLESDSDTPAAVRRAAVALARARGDDPEPFFQASRYVGYAWGLREETYRLARQRARNACEVAEAIGEDDTERARYHEALGVLEYRLGRYEAAVEELERVLDQASASALPRVWTLGVLALSHRALGEEQQAEEHLKPLRAWWAANPVQPKNEQIARLLVELGILGGEDAGG